MDKQEVAHLSGARQILVNATDPGLCGLCAADYVVRVCLGSWRGWWTRERLHEWKEKDAGGKAHYLRL